MEEDEKEFEERLNQFKIKPISFWWRLILFIVIIILFWLSFRFGF